MKQYSDMQSSAKLRRRKPYNSVTESTSISPDDLGVNITKSVFGWKTPASGIIAPNGADIGTNDAASNWIDRYGLPFVFIVGENQVLLPPAVQNSKASVPPLPDGLTVQWAASFMNVAIPPDMLYPICQGGKLFFNADSMQSAQGIVPVAAALQASGQIQDITGSLIWSKPSVVNPQIRTSAFLTSNGDTSQPNQGETLLRLLMAVMECIIYSYSSNPWGNKYADLCSTVMDNRDLPNWLIYPYQNNTMLGNLLSNIAPVWSVAKPFVSFIPVVGQTVAAAITNAEVKNTTNQLLQNVNTAETTTAVPAGTVLMDQGGEVVATSSDSIDVSGLFSNPLVLGAILIIIILIL